MARSEPSKHFSVFTIGVFIVMIISAGVLYGLQHTSYGSRVFQQQQQMPNLNDILDQITPTDEEISQAFQPRLDDAELKSKDIGVITKDGQLLRARVSKPAGHGPFPIIIILHEGSSSTRATDQTAVLWGESLSQTQQALTITPDWRESQIGEEEVTDSISVIDWVKKLREATDQPLYLFGMDHGVYIALATMAAEPESVDGLIAAYGYSDIAAEYHFLNEHDPRGAENFLDRTGCAEEAAVELCVRDTSVTDVHISVPTLLIHSEADTVVPKSQSEQIASQVTDPTLLTTDYIEDTNVEHFFLSKEANPGFSQAQQTVQDWLTAHL